MNILKYPPSIDWEVTSVCNHVCIHCYNYWRQQDDIGNYVKAIDKDYFIEIAKKMAESNPVSVQITGGEPLIVWDKIEAAIEVLLDQGIHVSMNTNATYVSDEIAEFLAKHRISAFVSLPCADEKVFNQIVGRKGAWKRAIAGIRKLIQHQVDVSLNMVVTKQNLQYVYETAKYAKEEFGVHYFSATKASFPQNADVEFRNQLLSCDEFNQMLMILLKVKKELGMRVDSAWVYSLCGFQGAELIETFGVKRRCGCGRYAFVVDVNGDIKACGCDAQTYGNILADTFEEAISKMKKWQDGSLLAEACKTCNLLKYCGGGCRSDSMSMNGNYKNPDSTADIKNRNNIVIDENNERFSENATFELNPEIKWVDETFGTRISYRTNYEYLTNEFIDFLRSIGSFSIRQLWECCGQEMDEINKCIQILVKKKMLIPTDRERKIQITKSDFELLAIPYCNKNASQLLKDYAGNACIVRRHATE